MSAPKSSKAGYWMFIALVLATATPVLVAHFVLTPASAAAPAATASLVN